MHSVSGDRVHVSIGSLSNLETNTVRQQYFVFFHAKLRVFSILKLPPFSPFPRVKNRLAHSASQRVFAATNTQQQHGTPPLNVSFSPTSPGTARGNGMGRTYGCGGGRGDADCESAAPLARRPRARSGEGVVVDGDRDMGQGLDDVMEAFAAALREEFEAKVMERIDSMVCVKTFFFGDSLR